MMRYKLPGGHEADLIRSEHGRDVFEWPLAENVNAELSLPQGLAKVMPPKEPPDGTVVRFADKKGNTWVAERDDNAQRSRSPYHWYSNDLDDGDGPLSWQTLAANAVSITRLIPDPAAEPVGPLPKSVRVQSSYRADAAVFLGTPGGLHLTAGEAKAVARALWATAVENQCPF